MKHLTRRSFLEQGGRMAAVGTVVTQAAGRTGVLGANDRINLAMIGCGGRGRYVMRGLMEEGANLVELCDLRQDRLDQTWKFLSEVQQKQPRFSKDMRKTLASKDIDGVVIGTPDRWHAPATILACQAGKDVYVEKPHSHNIWESEKMVEAAKKYDRIVQVGTQNRSGAYNLAAREYVKSGKLGKIGLVKVFNLKSGEPFRLGPAAQPPAGFDWDAWIGPAPMRPYHEDIFEGGWHRFWDLCSGDMGDDGIHQLDLALMLMGDPGMPRSVRTVGGRYVFPDDDSEVPDVQVASWDFPNFVLTFELSGYPRYMMKTAGTIRRNDEFPYWTHNATRVEIYGADFMMTLGRHGGGWIVQQSGGGVVEKMYGRPCDEEHYRDFLACMKSRKKPTADISIAHASNVILHMGNLAQRLGNVALKYDAGSRQFDNAKANQSIKPEYRNGYEIAEAV
jgi:predicted dehydrogenase